ncbi:YqiJ family protein [Sphingomonas cannabina]|uniref:YqiJ family protein n=1 Tax=Sphingomonas cannabina TaxID=2899123 RepID=UPI001F3FBCDB|nr:YqiJ family protein [Sphingomonas cannabina]UIJ44687.1 YqiJ family protein [Sphingomonas cannabina]
MLAFLRASENIAFVSAIVLMALIGVVQLVGLGGDLDADADADADLHAGISGDLLSWLGVGRLPLLMLLVVFLTLFGLVGLIGQQLSRDLTGALLTPWIAVPAAALAALPLTGLAARGLARILPRDFTTAVPLEVLVGRTAHILTGRASRGSPARARVEDQWGQAHYVMVEPDNDGQSFVEGEAVLLVRRENDLFRAIARGDHYLPRLEP